MTTDVTPGRQLQVKDNEGLTLQQRNLLQELALHPGDWKKACANAEVPPKLCQAWLSTNESFLANYNSLVGSSLDIVQDRMEDLAHRAGDMYEEAMEAVRYWSKDVTCPKCKNEFSVPSGGPDWNARLRSGDTIMKVSRILIDRKQIQQTNVNLSVEQSMALYSYRWSMANGESIKVKPSVIDELRRKGVINDNPTSGEVVDASQHRVQPRD